MPITHSVVSFALWVLLASTGKHGVSALTAEQIFQKCSPAVVSIATTVRGETAERGTGTVVAPEGFIVTNAHVVSDADEMFVDLGDGKLSTATLHFYDADTDLAVLSVDRHVEGLKLGKAKVQIGQNVFAIGNPQGLRRSISEGIVSGIRNDEGKPFIQHTAPISPGSSGGPLLTANGEFVGVNTFQYRESQNLNFAISATTVQEALLRAATQIEPLPSPAAIRRQRIAPLITKALNAHDYGAVARLSQEALQTGLQPACTYAAMSGFAYVESGKENEAIPFFRTALDGDCEDKAAQQTARWYLLKQLFGRYNDQSEPKLRGEIVTYGRAFLACSENPYPVRWSGAVGDFAGVRRAVKDTVAFLLDPSGDWTEESGALSRVYKESVLQLRCEGSKCSVRVKEHPSATLHELVWGTGTLNDDVVSGTFTVGLVAGSDYGNALGVWQQQVSFFLKWTNSFDALEGEITWYRGEIRRAQLPEIQEFFEKILSPATLPVRLTRIEKLP